MSDSNITKMAFADALKNLMAKKPFPKISVSDIVNACGLTRQAFYYHFKDKYDLMNWIYYTETARFMSSYSSVDHWTDGLKELCHYMRENKVFYVNALNTAGQDSFQEYLHKYITDISIAVIENMLNADFDHKKFGFTVDFFSIAFVGLIVKWANNGMKENPDDYVAQIRNPGRGAKSTDMMSPEDVHELSAKCNEAAQNWETAAEKLWNSSHACTGCTGCCEYEVNVPAAAK